MKQLHNIVAPLILFCLMAAVSLPVLAQEQEGEAVSQQTQDEITPKGTGEHGGCERNCVRSYRRLLRMAYYDVG